MHVRALVLAALEIHATRKGKTPAELLADEIDSKGIIHLLNLAAKYAEKEQPGPNEVAENYLEARRAAAITIDQEVEDKSGDLRH